MPEKRARKYRRKPANRTDRRTRKRRLPDHFLTSLLLFLRGIRFTLRRAIATVRWWWGLPRWLKWGKMLVIILAVATLPVVDSLRQWMHYRSIYSTYYTHFRSEYSQTLSPMEADYYASHYADFYARYYSSPTYRQTLSHALPSASPETVTYPTDSPVAKLRTNAVGLALIKRFEGLELEPYADAGGKLTIGYGHLIKPGEYFGRITEARAHELLREDVRVAEAYVKRYVKVQLNENQFAALVSLVYNIGPTNFHKSTLLRLLNQGQGDKAAREFSRWNKVGTTPLAGLIKRRQAERELFDTTPAG